MTDVKTLIAALTTERNAIDRAITGLQQMSELRADRQPSPPSREPRQSKRRQVKAHFTADQKAVMVARMAAAPQGGKPKVAAELSREFGAAVNTVLTRWHIWQRAAEANNGTATAGVQ